MRTVAIVSFAVLLLSPLARADLCPACADKMFITNIGKCVECGGETSSGAFKLCPACSRKLKQCQACRSALDAAKADDKGGDPSAPPRRKPVLDGPIRLVDRPAGRVVNDCLVLAREDAGLTARPSVGQPVIVQLTGDRTSGWEWKFDKASSDCVQAVGEARRRETPVEEGMLGGTVVFLFPFRAAKPGQAVLVFRGGRPWDWEKNTTQALKFNVLVREDPKVLTDNRRKELLGDLPHFRLVLRFYGPRDEPFRSLELTTSDPAPPADARAASVKVGPEAATRIVEHLADSGFLAAAIDRASEREPVYKQPCYVLDACGGKLMLRDGLGWDARTLARLQALAKTLDGQAAQAMQSLLDALKDQARQWEQDEKAEVE
ncbi:MAG: Chagasin family peptidase inhibitor I42 [Planctomycetes bacterium ADurb.Bin126]|nr:MAG: Chagasin family peptidase inhibitor I42 [Planctomycetes bacterium ADurb.Bin126]HOD83563.1 protease inhibitor I42 family protein [Phycisphaerae bacterium]HQL74688.1 protease inhibitor I42 family protein [Phycisphaerae bacterium]